MRNRARLLVVLAALLLVAGAAWVACSKTENSTTITTGDINGNCPVFVIPGLVLTNPGDHGTVGGVTYTLQPDCSVTTTTSTTNNAVPAEAQALVAKHNRAVQELRR